MSKETNTQLSRREREIMDVIYRAGRATAAEVLDQLADPPSYSTVRALLRVLEDKGHLRHEEDGPRYVFLPTVPRERARQSALRQLLKNKALVAGGSDNSGNALASAELYDSTAGTWSPTGSMAAALVSMVIN